LWNAGLEDRQFLTARIALCEEGLGDHSIPEHERDGGRRRICLDGR
jgi:hypothetical protein